MKKLFVFIWNSNFTEYPVFYLAINLGMKWILCLCGLYVIHWATGVWRGQVWFSQLRGKAVKTIGKDKLHVASFSSCSVKVLNAPLLLAVGQQIAFSLWCVEVSSLWFPAAPLTNCHGCQGNSSKQKLGAGFLFLILKNLPWRLLSVLGCTEDQYDQIPEF